MPNITITAINKTNQLSKRWNRNQAETLGVLIIRNKNTDDLKEEIHRGDKLDMEFGIEDYNEDTNGD